MNMLYRFLRYWLAVFFIAASLTVVLQGFLFILMLYNVWGSHP